MWLITAPQKPHKESKVRYLCLIKKENDKPYNFLLTNKQFGLVSSTAEPFSLLRCGSRITHSPWWFLSFLFWHVYIDTHFQHHHHPHQPRIVTEHAIDKDPALWCCRHRIRFSSCRRWTTSRGNPCVLVSRFSLLRSPHLERYHTFEVFFSSSEAARARLDPKGTNWIIRWCRSQMTIEGQEGSKQTREAPNKTRANIYTRRWMERTTRMDEWSEKIPEASKVDDLQQPPAVR